YGLADLLGVGSRLELDQNIGAIAGVLVQIERCLLVAGEDVGGDLKTHNAVALADDARAAVADLAYVAELRIAEFEVFGVVDHYAIRAGQCVDRTFMQAPGFAELTVAVDTHDGDPFIATAGKGHVAEADQIRI